MVWFSFTSFRQPDALPWNPAANYTLIVSRFSTSIRAARKTRDLRCSCCAPPGWNWFGDPHDVYSTLGKKLKTLYIDKEILTTDDSPPHQVKATRTYSQLWSNDVSCLSNRNCHVAASSFFTSKARGPVVVLRQTLSLTVLESHGGGDGHVSTTKQSLLERRQPYAFTLPMIWTLTSSSLSFLFPKIQQNFYPVCRSFPYYWRGYEYHCLPRSGSFKLSKSALPECFFNHSE